MHMTEKVCAHCGKKFIPAVEHRYKIKFNNHTYIMCSYSCYREIEKKIDKNKKYRKVL